MSQTRLRPLAETDSRRLLDWRNAPQVARWMYSDHLITPDEHARWFAGALRDPRRVYWIVEVDGEPAGMASLYDIDLNNGRASWAYYLAGADVRGRGVGACVEFQVLEEVFVRRGLNKLWCEVLVENEAVVRLHRSFGFREEALFRQHIRKGGRMLDVVGLGLLKDEWLALRKASSARLAAKGHGADLLPLHGQAPPL